MRLRTGGQLWRPVRLCCGQRHSSPVCPDGKVMCCLCFDRVSLAQLSRTEDGRLEDVCQDCAKREVEVMRDGS